MTTQLFSALILIVSLLTLTGCDGPTETVEDAANKTEAIDEGFYLNCNVTDLDAQMKNMLIHVPPISYPQDSLSLYDPKEKLYFRLCNTDILECSTVISDGIIEETGVVSNNGSVTTNRRVINRMTGKMVQEIKMDGRTIGSSEGQCEIGSAPKQETARF